MYWGQRNTSRYEGVLFENGVLRGIFGPNMYGVQGGGENYIMRSLTFWSLNFTFKF